MEYSTMTTIAMIQARMSSSRLSGKVLMTLNGKPVLKYICDAASQIHGIDKYVVLTSTMQEDDAIQSWCTENEIDCFRGDLENVLSRFYEAAVEYNADTIIRLTADCPLLDPEIVSQLLLLFKNSHCDYCSNVALPTWPDGLDCEVFSFSALEKSYKETTLPEDLEHVTRYIHRNRSRFSVLNMPCPAGDLSAHRWTLDTQADFDFLSALMKELPAHPSYTNVFEVLNQSPNLTRANEIHKTERTHVQHNHQQSRCFSTSKSILERAEKTIPLGTQTFSKSKLNCAPGHAPLFASHGRGGRIWDVDGNEYIDMVMGLLPTSLGYCDPDVDRAIQNQLNKGITLSLASELEYQLAERIVSMVPSAEKVRFGKNGTDATSAAIRLARAYTGQDKIMVCGYHGWQDWYIGTTTRSKGVPKAIQDLSFKVDFNNLQQVEDLLNKHKGEFAGLIMEPMNVTLPNENYLSDLKSLLHKHNAILIFDEVITGFRYAKGGAQEYFGITPDLTALGKGIANGMPLSAITGRADIMNEMDNIFFSGTFGGETLSLAAALAVMDKLEKEPVIETLWKIGENIRANLEKMIKQHSLENVIKFNGLAPWQLLQFNAYDSVSSATIKTYVLHELFKCGVFCLGSYNVCYAHSEKDLIQLFSSHDYVFSKLRQHLSASNLEEQMDYPTNQPVFQVRKDA